MKILSSSNSKIGSTDISQIGASVTGAISNLKNLTKIQLLWVNNNVAAGMEADTNISLSANTCDLLVFICSVNASWGGPMYCSAILPRKDYFNTAVSFTGQDGSIYFRRIDWVTNNIYKARVGLLNNVDNSIICVPMFVYGVN